MKSFCFQILLAIVLFPAAEVGAKLPSDAEIRTKLVGDWMVPVSEFTDVAASGEIAFKADGTFTSTGIFMIAEVPVQLAVEGKWKVQDGVLVEEVTKTSHPHVAPVGLTTRDTLLEVTDKEYRFRSEDGREGVRVRKPPTQPSPQGS
jgi:hypothetical protein